MNKCTRFPGPPLELLPGFPGGARLPGSAAPPAARPAPAQVPPAAGPPAPPPCAPRARAAGMLRPCFSPAPSLRARIVAGAPQQPGQVRGSQLSAADVTPAPAAPSYISHISGDLKLDTDFLRKHFGFVFTRWYWFQGVLLRRTQLHFH